jgi:hypothetical protein
MVASRDRVHAYPAPVQLLQEEREGALETESMRRGMWMKLHQAQPMQMFPLTMSILLQSLKGLTQTLMEREI